MLLKKFFRNKKNNDVKVVPLRGNINLEHNYIFIHIPKCAGTSIYKTLGFHQSEHIKAFEYKAQLKEKFDGFFKFAFVRNPFDRFISLYNYSRMEESYYHSAIAPEKSLYGKHLDYDTLIDASLEEAVDLLLEGKLIHGHGQVQWDPQYKWITDKDSKIVVDYIGRVEDLNLHMSNISRILKIEIPPLRVENISRSPSQKDYRKLFTAEMREKLEFYYKKDLELFGYEFESNCKYL